MKHLFTSVTLAYLLISALAQAPERMSYQAVIRNQNQELVTSRNVGIRIKILQESIYGAAIFVETHSVMTDVNGLATLEIGSGNVLHGSFSTVDWSGGTYFIETGVDPAGGSNYTINGVSQVLSVPYALHAKTVAGYNETDPVWSSQRTFYYTKNDLINSGSSSIHFNNIKSRPTTLAGYGITDFVFNFPSNNQLIRYNSGIGKWENWTPNFLTAISLSGQTAGDMMYFNGTSWVRLPKGTDGQVLAMSTNPGWYNKTLPVASINDIGTISSSGAGVSGYVNANGQITTVTFEYSTAVSFTTPSSVSYGTVTGTTSTRVTATLPNTMTVGTVYYCRIKAVNASGTVYSDYKRFKYLYKFAAYGGGVIVHIDETGEHGLICSTTDLSTGTTWGCSGTAVNALGFNIGDGNNNTWIIVRECTTAGIAAKLCWDSTEGGYYDWFLPSMDELSMLYDYKIYGSGSFANAFYWSSTERSATLAYAISLSGGTVATLGKGNNYYVRAVRKF